MRVLLTFITSVLMPFLSLGQATVWQGEAEEAQLIGTAVIDADCSNASGGEFVRLKQESGNAVVFNRVVVPVAGRYQVKIHYFYKSERNLEVFVNGVSQGIQVLPGAHWCYEGLAEVYSMEVDLNEGINSIKLQVANGETGPFIDKLAVVDGRHVYLNISSEKTKLIQGEETELCVRLSSDMDQGISVDLEVSGMESSSYFLEDNTLTIQSGEDQASTSFSIPDGGLETDQSAVISMTNPTDDVRIGYPDSLVIAVYPGNSNYYISSSTGSDTNKGTSPDMAWGSLEKVNHSDFVPGDSILLKAGDEFIGQLNMPSSGHEGAPIVIGSYGKGSKPVINGSGAPEGDHLAAILIHNQEYIEVQDLELTNDRQFSRTGARDNDAYGLYILNDGTEIMEHFVIERLTIREVYSIATDEEFNQIGVAGIGLCSSRNLEPGMAKHIRDVLVDSCYISYTTRFGIHSSHGGGVKDVGNDSLNRNMNLVFRNNHTFETGGSGITPGRSYNCLLENNVFEYPGSDADPRMTKRGSGAWFWNCRNVIAQYNKSFHVRGKGDSYGMHIDHGNKNVIFQYNYSQDSEGGFVEILGNNVNSVYRFNVSVNDGFRENQWAKGSTIWISRYAGQDTRIPSDSNYIYNNTVYISRDIQPDISIDAGNTFIFNNIFCEDGKYARIGGEMEVNLHNNATLEVSHNLYSGEVNSGFYKIDDNSVFGNPFFVEPGDSSAEGYKLANGSLALEAGKSFPEPEFPMAGKGIFRHISLHPENDMYGNSVNVEEEKPHIGAYNGKPIEQESTSLEDVKKADPLNLQVRPNPVRSSLKAVVESSTGGQVYICVTDIKGKVIQDAQKELIRGENRLELHLDPALYNGVYLLRIRMNSQQMSQSFLLLR